MKPELKIPNNFRQKLIEKGALEKFIKNCNEQLPKYEKNSPGYIIRMEAEKDFKKFISSCIVWEETPEKFHYWLGIATMDQYN